MTTEKVSLRYAVENMEIKELDSNHQCYGWVKTVRWGDRVTIKFWDLYNESDSKNLYKYLVKNKGFKVEKTVFI